MTTKEEIKICKICNLPIHEANLYQINGQNFHLICWEKFINETTNLINEYLKRIPTEKQIKTNKIMTLFRNIIVILTIITIIKIIIKMGIM